MGLTYIIIRKAKVGNFTVKAPMILGHEVIGKIVHSDSDLLREGQPVAINPSKPCGHCKYCLQHEENHCTEMRFFGSAMYFPHVDGGLPDLKLSIPLSAFPGRNRQTKKPWPLPNRWRLPFMRLMRRAICRQTRLYLRRWPYRLPDC
ncbi:L-idonate 5-dehydrogenase [Salmonella enterica subsp. enterica]|nr:L-idonate 5-dehydrogenase [Salmonella enterica subsp. enterica]